MGGFGSGRWRRGKNLTHRYPKISVQYLQREGCLTPGRTLNMNCSDKQIASIKLKVEPDQLILKYDHKRQDGTWQPMEYPIHIEWTPCHYGGQRPWFICPAKKCSRRAAFLYGSMVFACRKCHQLAYQSQRETADNRALRRAQNIREKLGGSGNMLTPFPPRPKRMRWHTYFRMIHQHNAFHRVALIGMAEQFGIKVDI